MILLITEITPSSNITPDLSIVSYSVVDGNPTKNSIKQLLELELTNVFGVSYCELKKKGLFFNIGRECIRGMHFNTQDHQVLIENNPVQQRVRQDIEQVKIFSKC